MRPVYCCNYDFHTPYWKLRNLFSTFGRVECLIMKPGFAFVYFKDECDAINAIRFLRDMPFGKAKRKLTVEWAGGERGRRHSVSASNQSPTNTLFVTNFDPIHTKEHDIERHFEPYGKVLNVRICRNFAFVDFETQEAATRALEHTHMSKILDSVVSVDHARRIPTKTLFVINFDPIHTGEHDIARHFEPYGKVLNVRIRRDFAFVRFETQEDATKALECTHMSKISDRVISVMYALRDDDNRGGRYDIPYGRREHGASWRLPSRYHRWGRIPDYGKIQWSSAYPRARSPEVVSYRSMSFVWRQNT